MYQTFQIQWAITNLSTTKQNSPTNNEKSQNCQNARKLSNTTGSLGRVQKDTRYTLRNYTIYVNWWKIYRRLNKLASYGGVFPFFLHECTIYGETSFAFLKLALRADLFLVPLKTGILAERKAEGGRWSYSEN
jgi:hypothetical protein